ncbi:site-specific integrase [Haloarcula laminariae]|uniref:site-specific integrase n=1 Tax=Haloarcula laminariae TaxID=2961577 RepID=UPI002404C99D|nr:site-specific integrase [Halomicroarcula sp. FL173]
MSEQQHNWSRKSLDELAKYYTNHIHPEFLTDSTHINQPYPTATWLREHGYSGIRYTLREHHDRTFTEFVQKDVGEDCLQIDNGGSESPQRRFNIEHEATEAAVDAYFTRREDRELLAESTLASRRSRFRTWVKTYRRHHGTDAILAHADDIDNKAAERRRARDVLDDIADNLGSDQSRLTFVADVRPVYSWLTDEGYLAFNPLDDVESEYGWERPDADNQSLQATDVQQLLAAADTPAETLLVTALPGWGLRPSEVAQLHVSQFALGGDDPHIAFEERKNGPGTVALHYGVHTVSDRIDQLAAADDWQGYLFPSPTKTDTHVHSDTITNRFKRLADRADVSVDGQLATPRTARRFWYSMYSSAMVDIRAEMDNIADEQGAQSGTVVWEQYLSEADRRRRRRQAMAAKLTDAFGTGNGSLAGQNKNLIN